MDAMLQPSGSDVIDCRGLQCPAPILRLAEAARRHRGSPAALTVLATDVDFPVDLEAWCRTTKAILVKLEREQDGVIRAQIQLQGASPTMPSGPARSPEVVAHLAEADTWPARSGAGCNGAPAGSPDELGGAPVDARAIDLTGTNAVAAMRKLGELSVSAAGQRVTILCDAPGFEGRLAAWTSATDTALETVHRTGRHVTAVLVFPPDEAPAAAPAPVISTPPAITPAPAIARAPAEPPATAPQALAVVPGTAEASMEAAVPRENRATLLVLHNDLEALLAALMVANASASQGMEVEVYFAFWGIHLLRGERPRQNAPASNRGIIQTMMLWMVPRGPDRQHLGKLHMGGIGTRILLWLMRKRNILALDKLVESAVAQGVKLRVCSMSMGLMGLSQRDIVELPNLTFAGVTSFAESARRSATSLVF